MSNPFNVTPNDYAIDQADAVRAERKLMTTRELTQPAPAPAPPPKSFRDSRIDALSSCTGHDRARAEDLFEREVKVQLSRLGELSPKEGSRLSKALAEASAAYDAALRHICDEGTRLGNLKENLSILAQRRGDLAAAEQQLAAAEALLASPDSLDEEPEVLVLAQQQRTFLPDQIKRRKQEVGELEKSLRELADGIDVAKLASELASEPSGPYRGWHAAGLFKL